MLRGFRRIAPLVLTVHDTNPFNGNPAAALQRHGAEASLAAFDRLIVHTEQGLERLLAQGIAPERIALLPHGLLAVAPDAAPEPAAADAMRGPLTFLLFGKLKPYKGLDLLVDAFAALPPGLRAQASLRIVGKPYMELDPLRERARALGIGERLSLEPGYVADEALPALFAPGTVAVFPYREIEASGVLSFALAHGRPVIASRLGSFAETLRDGEEGLLVPPGDVAALSAAMARMAEDRGFAADAAAAARRRAASVPSWEEIGRRTSELYAGLLRES
jgi:glycosyltransferase involved in cell wall biosynthesis